MKVSEAFTQLTTGQSANLCILINVSASKFQGKHDLFNENYQSEAITKV